jgi:ferric-dicitrate binding protein FerR (iron transport regulator)
MNYHTMIEPYLYGNLSPEDEVAFERQLSRDPALAEAAGRRLNAKEALAGIPEYQAAPRPRSSSARMLLFAGLAVLLLGLFLRKMRAQGGDIQHQKAPVETPVIQSGVPSE